MPSVKMQNSIRFMENIEELVQRTKMTYIDAVIYYCEENKLEPETAGQWLAVNLNNTYRKKQKNLTLFRRLQNFQYRYLTNQKSVV